jgi:hypothetical protein
MAAVAVCLPELASLFARSPAVSTCLAASLVPDSSAVSKTGSYSVRWVSEARGFHRVTVQVSGLDTAALKALQHPAWKPADWRRLLAVYVEHGSSMRSPEMPAMLGRYLIHSDTLIFEPQFPLEPGLGYRAVFHPGQLPGARRAKLAPVAAEFKVPANRSAPSTIVREVFPTAAVLPENLLKFYVHFSAPMSRGGIYKHIHLRSEGGTETELPFLEIDEELWNPAMTRLTLFIDPGRIKRGVRPLEEIGPALEAGKSYSLVIDSDWRDGAGNPLQAGFEKRFSVAAPDRDAPDPVRWKMQLPQPGTRAALVVTFPEPMDHALAQRAIQVARDSGEALEGNVALGNQERQWAFSPTDPWRPGPYQLVVPATLEDLAGNNIGKAFEVDLFEGVQRRLATSTIKLPFEVR